MKKRYNFKDDDGDYKLELVLGWIIFVVWIALSIGYYYG